MPNGHVSAHDTITAIPRYSSLPTLSLPTLSLPAWPIPKCTLYRRRFLPPCLLPCICAFLSTCPCLSFWCKFVMVVVLLPPVKAPLCPGSAIQGGMYSACATYGSIKNACPQFGGHKPHINTSPAAHKWHGNCALHLFPTIVMTSGPRWGVDWCAHRACLILIHRPQDPLADSQERQHRTAQPPREFAHRARTAWGI